MTVNEELLEILVCPETRPPVKQASADSTVHVDAVNHGAGAGDQLGQGDGLGSEGHGGSEEFLKSVFNSRTEAGGFRRGSRRWGAVGKK